SRREFAEAGGLMSYGPSLAEAWRQIGQYAGRILNGTRPEALPVQLQNKYELVINMKTVRFDQPTLVACPRGRSDRVGPLFDPSERAGALIEPCRGPETKSR